jgi:hypothetical protein
MGIERPGSPADSTADAIAYVCNNLVDIRACLESVSDPAVLDRLLEAVRSGEDAAGPMDDLNAVLQAAGDELGVYGYTRGAGTEMSLPGIGPPRPVEVVYLCPANRCSRYWWPDSSAAVPVCALEGQPLCAERL